MGVHVAVRRLIAPAGFSPASRKGPREGGEPAKFGNMGSSTMSLAAVAVVTEHEAVPGIASARARQGGRGLLRAKPWDPWLEPGPAPLFRFAMAVGHSPEIAGGCVFEQQSCSGRAAPGRQPTRLPVAGPLSGPLPGLRMRTSSVRADRLSSFTFGTQPRRSCSAAPSNAWRVLRPKEGGGRSG